MDKETTEQFMMASSDAIINLAKDVKRLMYTHPDGVSEFSQFESAQAFWPYTEAIYSDENNGIIDHEKAMAEKSRLLHTFKPVRFHTYVISGPAGSGKSTMANALAAQLSCLFTAGRNEMAVNIHNSISSHYSPYVGTLSALQHMHTPHETYTEITKEAMNPTSFADAQLSAMLVDAENYRAQLKNLSDAINSIESKICAKWTIADAARRQEFSKGTSKGRKRKVIEDPPPSIVAMTSKRRPVRHPEFTSLKEVLNGDSEMVEFAFASFYDWKRSDMPHLARCCVIVIDEAGTVNWYTLHTLALCWEMVRSRLGLFEGAYLSIILLGSEGQSSAIKSVRVDKTSMRNIADISILQHIKCPIMRKALSLDDNGRILMIHENKRCSIPALKPLFDKLYFGLYDPKAIEVLDKFVVPKELIEDPRIERPINPKQGVSSICFSDGSCDNDGGSEKLDALSDWFHIFPSRKAVQRYTDLCIATLPSVMLPVSIFINYRDFEVFFEYCRSDSTDENNGYDTLTLDEFITQWLNKNEIMGYSGGIVLSDCKRVSRELYELCDEFYPPLDLRPRPKNHIAHPLLEEDWENKLNDYDSEKLFSFREIRWPRLKDDIPRLPQQYALFKGTKGILLGKPGRISQKCELILMGFKGTVERFVCKTVDDMCASFGTWKALFVMQFIQQAYTFLEEYNSCSRKYVKGIGSNTHLLKMTNNEENTNITQNINTFDNFINMPDGKDQLNEEIPDEVGESEELYCKHPWRMIKADPQNQDLAVNYLTQAREDLQSLYRAVSGCFPDIKTAHLYLHTRDLINDAEALSHIKGIDYARGHRLFSSEVVTTYGIQKIPLDSYLVHSFYNYKCPLLTLTNMTTSDVSDLYGVIIHQNSTGYVGMVMPSSHEYIMGGLAGLPNLCLLSVIRAPVINIPASTVAKIQGQTLDKVAIMVGNGVFNHQQPYVALTRAKNKLVLSDNPFTKCKFIPQKSLLEDMLNKGTVHVV